MQLVTMDTDTPVDAAPAVIDGVSHEVAIDSAKSEAGESTATARGEKQVRIALFFGYLGTRFQGLQK